MRPWLGVLLWWAVTTAPARAGVMGEERFFAGCPHGTPVRLHDDANPWDLHALLYTVTSAAEVELLLLTDGTLDLLLPGRPRRPLRQAVRGMQRAYARLPQGTLTRRVGELVDALQVPELSLGDATSTYSFATGGTTGPGSGTIVRVNKLLDWTQRVVGDVNRLAGWPLRRPRGLIRWRLPERGVDGLQTFTVRAFNGLSLFLVRLLDDGLRGVEDAGEAGLRRVFPSAHRDTTVFLRMPLGVYWTHEPWVLEHRRHVTIGTPEEFRAGTHEALAHGRRDHRPADWTPVRSSADASQHVVLMTTTRIMARAPGSLKAYVVPAVWILEAI